MHARQQVRNARGQQQRVVVEGGGRVGHAQPGGDSGIPPGGLVVPGGHLGAPFRQPRSRRQPGLAEADQGNALSSEGGKDAFGRPIHAARLGRYATRRRHRIFSVLRPTSASTMAMIQKRMTMVGSAQPFFSK